MKEYVGILLDNSTSSYLSFFNNNVKKYVRYYQTYDQLLMQCDSDCTHLLIPLTCSRCKDLLQHAQSLQVQLYQYYFINASFQIYEMNKVGVSSLMKLDQSNMLNLCWNKQQHRIHMYDILYIESFRNQIHIRTTYENLYFRMRLGDILPLLDSDYFVRCHQSYIINMKYVYSLKRYESILTDGTSVPISKAHSKEVREFYKQLFING